MNLLYSNDHPGTYPPSYYAATAKIPPSRPPLEDEISADVAIVGGGYTGLSAALHLAEVGLQVVLLDAHRPGWGASGRNGGQLGTGLRADQMELEARFGMDRARALWDLSEGAKALARDLIQRHAIDCDLTPGILHANHRAHYNNEAAEEARHMQDVYDYPLQFLPREEFRQRVGSPAYHGGVFDPEAAHLHPLRYAFGLAKAAEDAGARIYETTEVQSVLPGARVRLGTERGSVMANHVVLACNGYLGGLDPSVSAYVMPINNFIIATAPLADDVANRLIPGREAVSDSKFVINYFRLARDNRLLFGGRESYGYRFPRDIRSFVRKAMVRIFPYLAETKIDYGWGGTLAITRSRLPYLRRIGPNIINASGYSGHGVALATLSGKLAAEAIATSASRFDILAELPHDRMPGGATFRHPLLVLAMLWYTLRDRI